MHAYTRCVSIFHGDIPWTLWFLYYTNCIFYPPKPTTDTGNVLHFRFSKLSSVWCISLFPRGHQKCPYKDKDLGYWHHCGDILSPLLSKGIPEQHTHFHNSYKINIGKPFLSNRHIFLYNYDIYIMGFSCLPYKACDKKYRNLNFVVFILTSRGNQISMSYTLFFHLQIQTNTN